MDPHEAPLSPKERDRLIANLYKRGRQLLSRRDDLSEADKEDVLQAVVIEMWQDGTLQAHPEYLWHRLNVAAVDLFRKNSVKAPKREGWSVESLISPAAYDQWHPSAKRFPVLTIHADLRVDAVINKPDGSVVIGRTPKGLHTKDVETLLIRGETLGENRRRIGEVLEEWGYTARNIDELDGQTLDQWLQAKGISRATFYRRVRFLRQNPNCERPSIEGNTLLYRLWRKEGRPMIVNIGDTRNRVTTSVVSRLVERAVNNAIARGDTTKFHIVNVLTTVYGLSAKDAAATFGGRASEYTKRLAQEDMLEKRRDVLLFVAQGIIDHINGGGDIEELRVDVPLWHIPFTLNILRLLIVGGECSENEDCQSRCKTAALGITIDGEWETTARLSAPKTNTEGRA